MEERSAPVERDEPLPVFAAYRRGYDPDQVDHYVAEQSARTEAANQRADEAERKLASAVAQLRELHKRVTVLESMEPEPQPITSVDSVPVDTLGVHVQRILSEAWDGAQALRQEAEQDASDLREKALAEGDRIVASARRKAESVGEELARRRQAYLERLEAERSKAVSQMSFLQEQREIAIADLHRVKAAVDSTIAEVVLSSRPAKPTPQRTPQASTPESAAAPRPAAAPKSAPAARPAAPRITAPAARSEPLQQATMPVHRLAPLDAQEVPDPSELVRSHRAGAVEPAPTTGVIRAMPNRQTTSTETRPSFFDFDEQEDTDH